MYWRNQFVKAARILLNPVFDDSAPYLPILMTRSCSKRRDDKDLHRLKQHATFDGIKTNKKQMHIHRNANQFTFKNVDVFPLQPHQMQSISTWSSNHLWWGLYTMLFCPKPVFYLGPVKQVSQGEPGPLL